jgi:serine/threonine protein kinase
LDLIGGGTFGKVFRCQRKCDGEIFAVKEIELKEDNSLYYGLKEITAMEKTQDTPYIIKYIQHFKMQDKI